MIDTIFYTSETELNNSLLNRTVQDIWKFFDNISQNTFNEFKTGGWKVIITSNPPTYISEIEEKVGYKLGGNTYRDYRLIYLYFNEENPDYLLEDFIHEFGHFVDWSVGYVSHSKEFENLFNKYQSYETQDEFIVENYSSISPTEFFACCYKDYYKRPEYLKKNASEIYDFIEDSIDKDGFVFYKRFFNYYF